MQLKDSDVCALPPCDLPHQVAPPPVLRTAVFPPALWGGTPVGGLERRLAQAHARMRCAGTYFE